jgi:hypothetical protein
LSFASSAVSSGTLAGGGATSWTGSNVVYGSGSGTIGTNVITPAAEIARGRGILSGGAMSIIPFALFTGGTTLLVSVIACWVFFRFLRAFIAPKDKDGKSWWQRFKERWTKEYKLRKLRREVERSHLEASVHLEAIDRDFPKKGSS